jgi:hypothetical protein
VEGKKTMKGITVRLAGFMLAAGLGWGQAPMGRATANPARPGSINYVEGQAVIGTQALDASAIGVVEVAANQSVTTQTGKVEILLTPGVFLRLADNSSLKMIAPDLTNTEVQLDKGRAVVEVVEIRHENSIRVNQNGATTRLLKKGLYDFDADHSQVRVFKGSAEVTAGNRHVTLGGEKMTTASGGAADLKAVKFESRQYEDDFYKWCGLRSGYLSEASMNAARTYIATGPEFYGPGWTGLGWYWDPWFGVYTFLPGDGVFYGGFGWGFYSPGWVFRSPYFYYPRNPHGFGEYHFPYGHGFPPPGRERGVFGGGGGRRR